MSSPVDRLALRQRLLQLLVAETAQLEQFVVLLDDERKVLAERNVEPLFGLAERKGQIAVQLQRFADARSALLAQAGLSNDADGIVALIGRADASEWTRYLSLAGAARDLNRDNGVRVTEMLRSNHQALAVLLAHTDQPTVYGRDGHTRTRPGSRHLGTG